MTYGLFAFPSIFKKNSGTVECILLRNVELRNLDPEIVFTSCLECLEQQKWSQIEAAARY